MRELLASERYRKTARFTIGLWLGGFAWLNLIMVATGRFYNGLAIVSDIPYCLVTLLLALGLQAWLMSPVRWPRPLRHLTTLLMIIILSLLSGLADTASNYWMAWHFIPEMRSWADGEAADWMRASFMYSWIYGLNAVVVRFTMATDEMRAQSAELTRALDAAQTARLTMLRYQLNPHFLFNTLNAISSLVLTRQNDRAEQMIDRLATFLRSTNSSDPANLVPLSEELSTIEDYLEVEAIRFGERMDVGFAIAADAGNVLVPSFLLQPIVENSVKYAVAPSRAVVTISIAAVVSSGHLTLTVEDDGRPEGALPGGTGIGLANVRARLTAFFGQQAACEGGRTDRGYRTTVTLPAPHPRR